MEKKKQLVTPYQMAKALGIRSQRVYNWVTRYDCPHTKVGDQVLVNPDEVREWMKRKNV